MGIWVVSPFLPIMKTVAMNGVFLVDEEAEQPGKVSMEKSGRLPKIPRGRGRARIQTAVSP